MPEMQERKTSKKWIQQKNSDICAKKCGCHYTVSRRGYPEHIKRKSIQLHLEGNGFRRIERILKVSHVSVINWVKSWRKTRKMFLKKRKSRDFGARRVVHKLKNILLWTAVGHATNRLVRVQGGTREKHFQKLTSKISHIVAMFYASGHWHTYNLIDPTKHLTGKAHTYTVVRMNRLLRHYLARFARKVYKMIKYSLLLLCIGILFSI